MRAAKNPLLQTLTLAPYPVVGPHHAADRCNSGPLLWSKRTHETLLDIWGINVADGERSATLQHLLQEARLQRTNFHERPHAEPHGLLGPHTRHLTLFQLSPYKIGWASHVAENLPLDLPLKLRVVVAHFDHMCNFSCESWDSLPRGNYLRFAQDMISDRIVSKLCGNKVRRFIWEDI